MVTCHDVAMSDTDAASQQELTSHPAPLIVLIHGAWHGAWCWATLQAELDSRGIASLAIDLPGHGASALPLGDLHGDVQHVADVLAVLNREVVLVGHSYGGAVITEATTRLHDGDVGDDGDASIAHLVYLAAFAPDRDETIMSLLGSLPRAATDLGAAMMMRPDGTSVLDPAKAAGALYGSCPQPAIEAALSRLSPQPMGTFNQPLTGAPRETVESTYVVCSLDRAIAADHQRAMAMRCTTTVTLETDHSPFVSMPSETADLLAGVLAAVSAGRAGADPS